MRRIKTSNYISNLVNKKGDILKGKEYEVYINIYRDIMDSEIIYKDFILRKIHQSIFRFMNVKRKVKRKLKPKKETKKPEKPKAIALTKEEKELLYKVKQEKEYIKKEDRNRTANLVTNLNLENIEISELEKLAKSVKEPDESKPLEKAVKNKRTYGNKTNSNGLDDEEAVEYIRNTFNIGISEEDLSKVKNGILTKTSLAEMNEIKVLSVKPLGDIPSSLVKYIITITKFKKDGSIKSKKKGVSEFYSELHRYKTKVLK